MYQPLFDVGGSAEMVIVSGNLVVVSDIVPVASVMGIVSSVVVDSLLLYRGLGGYALFQVLIEGWVCPGGEYVQEGDGYVRWGGYPPVQDMDHKGWVPTTTTET